MIRKRKHFISNQVKVAIIKQKVYDSIILQVFRFEFSAVVAHIQ